MTDVRYVDSGTPRIVRPKLQAGALAAMTWRVFRQRPWRFLGLALIPFVPAILSDLSALIPGRSGGVAARNIEIVVNILQYVLQFVCQAAIVVAAARVVSGQSFRVGQVFGAAIRRLLPILGVLILSVIVFFIGFLLLIIPGLVLGVYMMLGVPACVLERTGPIAALERSYALTRGNWWRIVGAVCLALIFPILAVAAIMLVLVLAFGISKLWVGLALAVIGIPSFLVLTAVASIFYGVLFVELRTLKEGPPGAAIAEVFT